uniref:Minor capsid protein P8 central region domain-containing protein n=1 Tax=viral metagenome TaxID=1070528 RepID=A0A6C0HKT7_9ZZZZ
MSTIKSKTFANFQNVDNLNTQVRTSQYNYNGRIFLAPDEQFAPYDLYKDSSKPQDTNTSIISNIVVPNAVSRTFFSNTNMERLQSTIIDKVYTTCSKRIGKQSYEALQIIMKSIYLQYSKNLLTDIEEQVVDLNNMVINECTNRIVSEITQYIGYLKDITSPIPIMPLPQNVSNKGYKYGDLSSTIPSSNPPYM